MMEKITPLALLVSCVIEMAEPLDRNFVSVIPKSSVSFEA
jgi:hypothetical protein